MLRQKNSTNSRAVYSSSSSSSRNGSSTSSKRIGSRKKRKSPHNRIPMQRHPSSQSFSRGRAAAAAAGLPSTNAVTNAINAAMRRQNKINDRLQESVELYPAVEGDCDDGDSASPIMELFINESGPGAIKAMTPLTRLEFERLWDIVSVPFVSEFRNGRGRQPSTKPKDALFVTLCTLKLPTTWANVGSMFAMSAQRVEKLVWKVIDILAPLLKNDFVREVSISKQKQTKAQEPLRPRNVIHYYSPLYVHGDPRGVRTATVLSVHPNRFTILTLSNGECLPVVTEIRRVKVRVRIGGKGKGDEGGYVTVHCLN